MRWPAIGGLVVSIGSYFQPRAFGLGYDVIGGFLQHHLLLSTALVLLAVKACRERLPVMDNPGSQRVAVIVGSGSA